MEANNDSSDAVSGGDELDTTNVSVSCSVSMTRALPHCTR